MPPKAPPPEFEEGTTPVETSRPAVRLWAADVLLATEFPELKSVVENLVYIGLSLLVGGPKKGKSWLAYALAIAVSQGGKALGCIPVAQGDVLYLALEDTPRRLQSRMRDLLGAEAPPKRLTLATEWPRMDEGGAEAIDGWLQEHPEARLVIVDVLAKVRSHVGARESVYAADYEAMQPLKELADRYEVAVVVLHHTRKASADDWIDTLSGSQGLAGAADCTLLLSRSRGRADGELKVTGRDVEEAEYALKADLGGAGWTLLGDASEWSMTAQRQQIVDAVRVGGSLRPKEIAEATGLDHDVVRQLVRKMVKDDELDTDGQGTYLPVHSIPSVHPVPTDELPYPEELSA